MEITKKRLKEVAREAAETANDNRHSSTRIYVWILYKPSTGYLGVRADTHIGRYDNPDNKILWYTGVDFESKRVSIQSILENMKAPENASHQAGV
jgi:hypothetical protein